MLQPFWNNQIYSCNIIIGKCLDTVLGSSPGSSSTASWSTGSSSPPLSDDGKSTDGRFRTSSISTSDEGIVMDYSEEMPRKRRVSLSFTFICTKKLQIIVKCEMMMRRLLLVILKRPTRSNHNDVTDITGRMSVFFVLRIHMNPFFYF